MSFHFRQAKEADLPQILGLLNDDILGKSREETSDQVDESYPIAFKAINDDPNNWLIVVAEQDIIIGFCQLTFIPGLSRGGAWRAQIESVRIASNKRSNGIGAAMMHHVIDLARQRNCRLMQLTSDKHRLDAHRFYAKLGFVASHDGFKLTL
jgi:GNAT superfamily N-acetyltransferase